MFIALPAPVIALVLVFRQSFENRSSINPLTYCSIDFQNESIYEELPDGERTSQHSASTDLSNSIDSSMFNNVSYLNQLSIGIVLYGLSAVCMMYLHMTMK